MTETEQQLRALLEKDEQQRAELAALSTIIKEVARYYWAEAYGLQVGGLIRVNNVVQRIEVTERWMSYLQEPCIKCSRWISRKQRWSKARTTYYPGEGKYTLLPAKEAFDLLAKLQEVGK